ncbi:MAG: hypothetical protein ACP5I3_04275, partial [Thermoproteus sp.]
LAGNLVALTVAVSSTRVMFGLGAPANVDVVADVAVVDVCAAGWLVVPAAVPDAAEGVEALDVEAGATAVPAPAEVVEPAGGAVWLA